MVGAGVGVKVVKAILHEIFVPFVLGVGVAEVTGSFPWSD